RAPVADDGSFLACGLTTDATLSLRVTATSHRTLDGDIVIPSSGVLHRDITLADTTALKGTARLAGRVILADGKPLPSGQAIISALNIDVPVVNGQFSIAGIPAGTWQVDARALGYEPQSALVDVREGAPATVLVRLTERAQVLDAVSVVGRANNAVNKELKILEGINERSRMAAGTVFGPGSEALKNALVTADVLRYARGFRYISPTVVQGRNAVMVADKANTLCVNAQCNRQKQDSSVIGFAFQNEPCSTEIDDDKIASPTARKKRVMIYLDGMIFNGNLEMLNTTLAMSEVLAVEAYPDVGNAPPIWRTAEACAIIAVWRKR
ncbi:MAG: carboxypeptidase-like regulatory domain-containing protein, partial [Gemmatimonadaceae bacterium]